MSLPFTFAALPTGNTPAADLDQNFAALGALTIIPCTASGTNAITLTPVSNTPTVSSYSAFQQFSFVAAATSSGAVTVNVNGVGAVPLNVIGGSQAGSGQIQSGVFYVIALNANGTAAVIVSSQAPISNVMRTYISGLTLSNDGGSPNTVIDVSAGVCADSTNTVNITLAAFTKSISGAWASGSGSNGMGTGVTFGPTGGTAGGPWFHVFAIVNSGLADVYIDNSASAANKPANTSSFRRIGSIKSDGASHIIAFVQTADLFEWLNPSTDEVSAVTNSTTAVNQTVNVPNGVGVFAELHLNAVTASANGSGVLRVYDPSLTDFSVTTGTASGVANVTNNGTTTAIQRISVTAWVKTSASGQVRVIGDGIATGTYNLRAVAWRDFRGTEL